MKKLKKVYVEVTNACNLSCDFCIKNDRDLSFISDEDFSNTLDKIKDYTDYIYMHVMGEPTMHPRINELINLAHDKGIFINITTNGYLIDKIKDNKNIRQINISLHSFDPRYKKTIEEYMNNIFDAIEELSKTTYISLRIWTKSKYTTELLNLINNRYNTSIKIEDIKRNITIKNNIFMSTNEEFIWPDLNNQYYEEEGTCYALKDHIAILVDGTISPCCLDSKGAINLGNIKVNTLAQIFNSKRVKIMQEGFNNNKKIEPLCKHCKYYIK